MYSQNAIKLDMIITPVVITINIYIYIYTYRNIYNKNYLSYDVLGVLAVVKGPGGGGGRDGT